MTASAPPAAHTAAPRATARLQLHAGFTLDDACAQAPYYEALGISHLYLSPITQARAGSTHGYDVIDHRGINPELGGETALRRLADTASRHGMGLIADIVPNHMAAHASNPWWADVLRAGMHSLHAHTFDIDWQAPDPALRGKVLLPILGDAYGDALAAGGIALIPHPQAGRDVASPEERFCIDAGGQHLPLAPGTAPDGKDAALACASFDPRQADGAARLHALLERQHYRLAWWRTAPDQINWRRFFEISELVGVRVEDEAVFNPVHALALQLYREGVLDGLRIDHVDGLASPGAYLRRLRHAMEEARADRILAGESDCAYLVVEKILAQGESLDPRWPVDGTTGYDFMDQVGALLHAPDAQAPFELGWKQVSEGGDGARGGSDGSETGAAEGTGDASMQLRRARQRMLTRHFPAERQALVRTLSAIARQDLRTRDWTPGAIDRALSAMLTEFPVYRSYAEDGGRSAQDAYWCRQALDAAKSALGASSADARLAEQLDAWLGGRALQRDGDADADADVDADVDADADADADANANGNANANADASIPPEAAFTAQASACAKASPRANASARADLHALALRRFQQLTPPLAAKALEDTLFYRRGPLLSRNEVGASPAGFALSLDDFHALSAARAAAHPHAMLATATHDNKRGEDTRARLAVLTETPDDWWRLAQSWIARLAPDGPPSAADRYLLLQSLVGAWPLTLSAEHLPEKPGALFSFLTRIDQWQEKALREAKLHTSWTDPDAAYEDAARRCVHGLQDTADGLALLQEIAAYAWDIAPAGLINSVTQTVLRNTLPGVPDLYQGADLWDFSLVDPDNRRPVDYAERAALMAAAGSAPLLSADATVLSLDTAPLPIDAAAWHSGAIKQQLIRRTLALRTHDPALFAMGDLRPLAAQGPRAAHVIAYLRQHAGRTLLVVAPRLCARALAPYAQGLAAQASAFWDGTTVTLPAGVDAAGMRDALSGHVPTVNGAGELPLSALLADCPVSVCVNIGAGVRVNA